MESRTQAVVGRYGQANLAHSGAATRKVLGPRAARSARVPQDAYLVFW
jgi:hypothetical protein